MKVNHTIDFLSVVVPCYNEANNISLFMSEITKLKLNNSYEIIFVDDGSSDQTWEKISQQQSIYTNIEITAIQFTRNFGKESALEAGFNVCNGDIIISIDCDLQHPVSLIPALIKTWQRNQDIHIVNAVKFNRQEESFFKKVTVNLYYYILSISTGLNLKNHSDFKLIDRLVLTEYLQLNETNKFFRGLTKWLGFSSIDIEFTPNKREFDQNSWSFSSLLKYAKGSILSFSYIPLKLITWVGVLLFIFSFVLTIDTLIKKFNGTSAEGFPTVILLQLGIGSLILFSLGIIGEYLSEIYKEIKNRPTYVVHKKTKGKNQSIDR